MKVRYANIVNKVIDSKVFAIIKTIFSVVTSVNSLKHYALIHYDDKNKTINPMNHTFYVKELSNELVELTYKKQ